MMPNSEEMFTIEALPVFSSSGIAVFIPSQGPVWLTAIIFCQPAMDSSMTPPGW